MCGTLEGRIEGSRRQISARHEEDFLTVVAIVSGR